MRHRSQTLRRLGTAVLGAVIAIGTPVAAMTGTAAASVDGIQIVSQSTGTGSTLNDGTNTTIKISAVIMGQNELPAGYSVQFSYTGPGAAQPVIIGTDSTAPYSIEWAPNQIGNYTEIATVLDDQGQPTATTTSKPVTVGAYSSVHITSPTDGSNIGVSGANTTPADQNVTFNQGQIVVSGTRSADLPAIDVYVQTRNNTTGELSPAGPIDPNTDTPNGSVPQGDANNGDTQQWSVAATVPQCPGTVGTSGCDVVITAVATGSGSNGTSDEVVQAHLYQQTLTNGGSLTIAPSSNTTPVGTWADYTVTAKDQNGQPIAGLEVWLCADHPTVQFQSSQAGSATVNPGVPGPNGCTYTYKVVTDQNGQAKFQAKDSKAETSTITASSNFQGDANGPNFNNGNTSDVSATAQLITYTAQPTTGSFIAIPQKDVYASQTEYTNYIGGAEAQGNTPQTEVCIVDQNGNPFANQPNPPAGLFVTITRQTRSADASGSDPYTTEVFTNDPTVAANDPNYDSSFVPTLSQDTSGDHPGCYYVTHPAAGSGNEGTDTYSATWNNVSFTSMTLKFEDLTINGSDSLTQKGTVGGGVFHVVGSNGTPFANRQITLTIGSDTTNKPYFPNSQPSGTTVPNGSNNNAHSAICTTDSNGDCFYNLTEPANGANNDNTVTVTATDDITAPANPPYQQIATDVQGFEDVTFTNTPVVLSHVTTDSYALYPDSNNNCSDNAFFNCSNDQVGAPGAPLIVTMTLKNASFQPLSNASVTVTTDHGYFTPLPTTEGDWSTLQFQQQPADQQQVGDIQGNDLVNNGTTWTGNADSQGNITFALAIARDPGFDDDGNVTATLTVSSNGGTVTVVNPAFPGDAADPSFSTDSQDSGHSPINPGAIHLLALPGRVLGGDVQAAQGQFGATDAIRNGRNFLVHTRDGDGNLVQDWSNWITLSADGQQTYIDDNNPDTGIVGSYLNEDANGTIAEDGSSAIHNVTDYANNTAGQDVTVTATWPARTTMWSQILNQGQPTVPPTYEITFGTQTLTDFFTVHLYTIDVHHLRVSEIVTPRRTVHTRTTVHDTLQIRDQFGHYVHGLIIDFFQSGPGPFDTQGSSTTDNRGLGAYAFSSARQGDSQVTADVHEAGSNVKLFESIKVIHFDGTPSINARGHRSGAGRTHVWGHTRPGALVRLYGRKAHHHFGHAWAKQRADENGNYSFRPRISGTRYFHVIVDKVAKSATVRTRVV